MQAIWLNTTVFTALLCCFTIRGKAGTLYNGTLKGRFLQSHQDNSKYTQQYSKNRKVVKFSVAGVFACVLLGAMLALSAFSSSHTGTSSVTQSKPQLAVAATSPISHQIQTRKAVSSVVWRQFHQSQTSKPRKTAPQLPGARAARVVVTPAPVVTATPAPVVTATVPTPTPVPTQPVATPPPSSGGSGSIVSMIDQVFGADAPTAVQIATCESGLNPNAYNPTSIGGSHAAGLFQILYPSTWYTTPEAGLSPYDAMANIQAAHSIFVRDGYSWREWTCQ